MKSYPLVSVIIPSYNHEKYIEKTIHSIIDQTYENIELIIIDDGSSDGSASLLNEIRNRLQSRFYKITIKFNQNKGLINSLNDGLKIASGEYIYIIASDDIAESDAIEVLQETLSSDSDLALAVGGNRIIDSSDKICYWTKEREITYNIDHAYYVSFTDFLKKTNALHVDFNSDEFGSHVSLMFGNYIPNGYLIRKDIFDAIGPFTTEAPLEDYWMMLQISKVAKFKYVDRDLFRYRWHASNTVKNKSRMMMMSQKTFDYEISLIKNGKFRNLYDEFVEKLKVVKTRVIFRIGPFSVIKTRDLMKKCVQFSLFGKSIKIIYKNL